MTDIYGTQENFGFEPIKDDLTKIKGIGTTTAEKLYNAKIVSIQQIAEMSPEKLAVTPGIGLVTATKFIVAAKNYLESTQVEEILFNVHPVQELNINESASSSIERYEIEEVIIEDQEELMEESQINEEEDIDSVQEEQKWFPDKFNYSRLTKSYPLISKRAIIFDEVIEEEKSTDGDFEDQFESDMEQPDIDDLGQNQMLTPETSVQQNQLEVKKVINTMEEKGEISKNVDVAEFKIAEEHSRQFNSQYDFSMNLKGVGCYEIPRSLQLLTQYTSTLDYLGCKLVDASESVKILFLFPIGSFDREGTVLVDETKIEVRNYSNKEEIDVNSNLEQMVRNLLQVRNSLREDLENKTNIREFFQKYLQMDLLLANGFGRNYLVLISGSTQYKVVIEPILVCDNQPRCMEKILPFPYQKSTNLHVIKQQDLVPLVKFLEKKYQMVEKRTNNTSSVKDYQLTEEQFRSRVKYASIPIFGYSLTLMIIYFLRFYFLLRLFNTIGFAVVGIYFFLIILFSFRQHKSKKLFLIQSETPYYKQNLEFNDTDMLDFREELTDELMAQFGYECLAKSAESGIIDEIETNALKNSLETKRSEPILQNLFKPEKIVPEPVTKSPLKYGTKYSSFLEDS